ncbi:MAG: alginate export family protein [Bacteroidales bacterium]
MKKNSIICFILLGISFPSMAQLSLDAEYRPRFELRHGYRNPAQVDDPWIGCISQRSRLNLTYSKPNFRLHFSPQDVRVWGDEQLASSTGVYGDDASLTLFQAYAEIRTGNVGYVSVGRQPLVYDNQRLLADRNWNQNGLAYDAVVFKGHLNKWDLHAGASWNSNASLADNCYPSDRIKSLNYLWLNRKFSEQFHASFLHIASSKTQTDTTERLYFRQTSGIYVDYSGDALNFLSNLYYQYGKNKQNNTINAWLADAKLSYRIGKFKPGLGFSYLSGDSNPGTGKDQLFDVLYGARHRFFGHMDYFRNIPSHTNYGGLEDYYLFTGYNISNAISIKDTWHYFRLASTNQLTPNQKNLGMENEISINWKINEYIEFESSWLIFNTTEAFQTLKGYASDKYPQFFYIELTINPTLFTNLKN